MMLAMLSAATAAAAPLRVLGLQIEQQLGVERNLQRAEALIRANPGYALYVLPELSCTGYNDDVLSALDEHAQEADHGPIADKMASVAREACAHVCYGFVRRTLVAGVPRYSICQAVMAPDGTLALAYEKMHLCDMGLCSEVAYGLQPGSEVGIFECGGVRVGVTVCYDLRFPELYRRLVWDEGCDLVLHPCAFIRDATFPTYHQFATARAVENGAYLLSVNFAGADFGDSIAVPPCAAAVARDERTLKNRSSSLRDA